jgi:hypothetical protein
MPRVTPEQYANKMINRLSGATEDIRRGVENVATAPTAEAAKKADKYLAGVQGSVDKWKRNLMKVGLDEWKQAMVDKGLPRVASGIANAKPKLVAFATELLPYVGRGQEKIKAMPDLSQADSRNRMNAWFDHMSAFKRSE